MNGVKLYKTLQYSQVFDDKHLGLNDYLGEINKEYLLDVASYFLNAKEKLHTHENLYILIGRFLSKKNKDFGVFLFEKINKVKSESESPLVLINEYNSLQLFQYAIRKPDNKSMKCSENIEDDEINIIKAYLTLNEINAKSNEELLKNLTVSGFSKDLNYLFLFQSFIYQDISNFSEIDQLISQIFKVKFLINFLKTKPELSHLNNLVLREFDCLNFEDLFYKIVQLLKIVINSNNRLEFLFDNSQVSIEFNNFVKKLSINQNLLSKEYDFCDVRNNPIYLKENGTFRIIYKPFLIQLPYNSIFFKFLSTSKIIAKESSIKDFKAYFSDEFSEKYLFYEVIKLSFNNKYKSFSGEEIKGMGYHGEPDYYVRNGNKIFLFESKDILINAEIKSSNNFTNIEKEIKKKLYFKINKKEKVDEKAVMQLTKNILRVRNQFFKFDNKFKVGNCSIYPIIVVHNQQFNVAGLNKILNSWFISELKKDGIDHLFLKSIWPITLISIDSLISNLDLFQNGKIKLQNVIEEYQKASFYNLNSRKTYTKETTINKEKSSTLPFSTYFEIYKVKENITSNKSKTLKNLFKKFE